MLLHDWSCHFFSSTQVGNLAAPVEEWTVGGTALTSLMDVERRHGNFLAFTFAFNRGLLNYVQT